MHRSPFIALTDSTAQDVSAFDVVELTSWKKNDTQQFLLTETHIYELQQLEEKYRSFLIESLVVSNSNLLVMTAVDPLFWVLALQQPATEADQWQPLPQITERLAPEVLARLDTLQLGHLFAHMSLGGDDAFYKFSRDKALVWLVSKVDQAKIVLKQQAEESATMRQRAGGAFASDFVMADAPTSVTPAQTDRRNQEQDLLLNYESLQVVCNYLTPVWQTALREHLQLPDEALTGQKVTPAPTFSELNVVVDWNDVNEQESKKPKTVSLAEKKLQKVDKRGMSKLSSFFTPKTKK